MGEDEVRLLVLDHIAKDARLAVGSRVIHELALTQQGARVDIAVIGASLVGFEIKSARDTLTRLAQQQAAYGLVFDRMFIATTPKHLERAVESIPHWWGVLEMSDWRGQTRAVLRRPSRLNPDSDIHAVVQLLWRDEVLNELERLGLDQGVRSASRSVLWERLSGAAPRRISHRELKARVRLRLRSREDWRAG